MKKVVLISILFSFLIQCSTNIEFTDLPIGGNIFETDKLGKTVDLRELKEPVLLVFFGYTYCPDFCPNTLAKIQAATSSLPEETKKKFRVVFVSIDPKNDSEETVNKYVKFYLPESIGYSFSEDTTNKILKQFAAYKEKTEVGFDHSTYIYVLDKDRRTKKLIKSTDPKEVITDTIVKLSGNSI